MKRTLLLLFLLLVTAMSACQSGDEAAKSEQPRARNVILFLGDGTGIPTLNAASILGHGEAGKLFLYSLPHSGLMDTSAADGWVTDSAAGMTAIMTGFKTNNGVVAQGPDAVKGEKDGAELKTLLEFAEERGLATGVVSNSPMADATPASCYAHCNSRDKFGEIFAQVTHPRFGDGVDVVIGPGRQRIETELGDLGFDLRATLEEAHYVFAADQESMTAASAATSRLVALYDAEPYDLAVSVTRALDILTRDQDGFFLMVESNNHSTDVESTLRNALAMDEIIKATVERMTGTETLIIYTADHSYDVRLPNGPRTSEILDRVVINDTHTAEEVLVTAVGPGAEQIRGYFRNTDLFHFMKDAFGW